MPSFYADVGSFHAQFGLPHAADGSPPGALEGDVLAFRVGFLLEELSEFMRAASRNDLAKMTDALVDLTYVALGTAHLMALPFDEAWAEVHAANLRKVRATGNDDRRSIRGHAFDVVKPEGWVAPDIEAVLEKRRREMRLQDGK